MTSVFLTFNTYSFLGIFPVSSIEILEILFLNSDSWGIDDNGLFLSFFKLSLFGKALLPLKVGVDFCAIKDLWFVVVFLFDSFLLLILEVDWLDTTFLSFPPLELLVIVVVVLVVVTWFWVLPPVLAGLFWFEVVVLVVVLVEVSSSFVPVFLDEFPPSFVVVVLTTSLFPGLFLWVLDVLVVVVVVVTSFFPLLLSFPWFILLIFVVVVISVVFVIFEVLLPFWFDELLFETDLFALKLDVFPDPFDISILVIVCFDWVILPSPLPFLFSPFCLLIDNFPAELDSLPAPLIFIFLIL